MVGQPWLFSLWWSGSMIEGSGQVCVEPFLIGEVWTCCAKITRSRWTRKWKKAFLLQNLKAGALAGWTLCSYGSQRLVVTNWTNATQQQIGCSQRAALVLYLFWSCFFGWRYTRGFLKAVTDMLDEGPGNFRFKGWADFSLLSTGVLQCFGIPSLHFRTLRGVSRELSFGNF